MSVSYRTIIVRAQYKIRGLNDIDTVEVQLFHECVHAQPRLRDDIKDTVPGSMNV